MRVSLLIGPTMLLLGSALAAPAQAAPVWSLDLHHNETNFTPGNAPGSVVVSTDADGISPDTNEVQRIVVRASTGQFKLGFGPNTTGNLPFNASAATVQTALRALPSIGASNVTVTQASGFGGPYLVTFTGALAATDVPLITGTDGTTPLRRFPEFWFDLVNSGDSSTTSPITVTVNLPNGLTFQSVRESTGSPTNPFNWSCSGASPLTCTATAGTISRHDVYRAMVLAVSVAPTASGDRDIAATVSGGGANAPASTTDQVHIGSDPAPFGIDPASFTPEFYEADGATPVRQAGAHPALFSVPFDFNTVAATTGTSQQKEPSQAIRDLAVDLPQGFLGDPTAVGECTPAELTVADCPRSSQVGRVDARIGPVNSLPASTFGSIAVPVFNMAHPRGVVTDLGLVVADSPVHIKASLDPSHNYAITTTVSNLNETIPIYDQRLTVWGVPADPSHDSERCSAGGFAGIDTTNECAAGVPRKPFLTVPFQCGIDHQMRLHHYDSWQETGMFGPDISWTFPGQFTGCDQTQAEFHPTAAVTPTNTRADSPTGLNVEADIPFNADPDGLATPPVKGFEVKLPVGMALNPSFADGLRGCTEAEIGITHAGVPDDSPVTCPDQSRIGSVELSTPLLPTPAQMPPDCPGTEPLQGSIYLAKQTDNPVNSLFALYTVVHDCEDRGLLLKLPGAMTLDPVTGQITTTFDKLPQLPFDHLSVHFRGGDRAPLVNPPTCGIKTATGTLNTWSEPQTDVAITSSYEITQGADGGSCFADLLSRPFAPTLEAGTKDPVAGTFSPFVLKMTRADGEQEPIGLSVALPPGLTGKLAGVAQCSDAAIGSIPTEPGTGAAELANPTCPPDSRVGTVYAGSGAGSQPFFIEGSAYLAGPFDGAPLSLAIVTPAVAGGIDLGNVVLRSALRVDPRTAQITVDTSGIPTIVHGVPIHLREIRVKVDRSDFTINPTSCNEMAVKTTTVGSSGATSQAADRFQVGDCDSLGFSPKLSFTATGGKKATKRNQHPGLDAELSYPPGYLEGGSRQANIASVEVTLPKQLLLDQSSPAFATICTRPQYAAEQCPASTQVGTATATSPLLDEPLSGPVYLKSSDNQLPDLAADLNGIIDVDVFGRIDQDHGRIRNTFDVVPDAPVSHFSLQVFGGKDGVLVNANAGKGLCESKKRRQIDVVMNAQDGDRQITHPMLQAKCPKKKRGR